MRRKAYNGAVCYFQIAAEGHKNNVEKYKFIYAIYAKYTRFNSETFLFRREFRKYLYACNER